MKHIRRLLFALLAGVLACSFAAPVRAAEPVSLNVINLPADSSAVLYYALDLGYFKDVNLDVKISPMTNSAAVIAAVAGGGGDIGNSVVGAVTDARTKGIPVLFLAPAGLYDATSPTAALVTADGSPLRKAADLSGKVVAVSGLNDLTYFATRAWIDQNGGSSAAVKFIELPFPAMAAALEQKRIDAAYLIDPFLTAAGTNVHIMGRAAESVAARYQATGFIATDAWLASHTEIAQHFSEAIHRAALWANAHQKESAAILLKYTKIDPAVVEHMHRAIYAVSLDPRLLQPPIDLTAKYTGNPVVKASTLIWTPAK